MVLFGREPYEYYFGAGAEKGGGDLKGAIDTNGSCSEVLNHPWEER